jgi:hypothetical protein
LGVAVFVSVLFVAAVAQAQPGQPTVQLRSDFSVVLSYPATGIPPASGALVVATYNGGPIAGSPFNIGQATTVASGRLALGVYTVQVLWGPVSSPVTTFTVTPVLGAPNLRAAGVDLNTVSLTWDAASGPVEGYDLEATASTGQVYFSQLGPATSIVVHGVYPGSYSVRVRARNASGVGPYSNSIQVTVGRFLGTGDLQVTLTWNSTADIDLHLLEPDLTHVYYDHKEGRSARLDFDDVDGFGPETIFAAAGRAMPGIYQIYIIHAGQNVETTATISVTLGANSANPQTAIFTRRTRRAAPGTAVMVAFVNVQTGQIVEMVNPGGTPLTVDEATLTGGMTSGSKSK